MSSSNAQVDITLALKGARSVMDGVREITRQFGGLSTILGGISLIGIAHGFREMINGMDEAGKSAQKVGMLVEQLTALQYAAKLSDVSAADFATSMKFFNRAVAEASQDQNSDPGRIFGALNVSIQDAHGKLRPLRDLLLDLADRFASFSDGPNKAAAAMAIFGRSGVDMIPFLNTGRGEIERLEKQARELGVTVDKISADLAQDFNDSLTTTQKAVSGLGMTILKDFLPHLTLAANMMRDWAADGKKVSDTAWGLVLVFKVLALGIRTVYWIGEQLRELLGAHMSTSLRALAAAANIVSGIFKTFLETLEKIWALAKENIKTLAGLGTVMGYLAKGQFVNAWEESKDIMTTLAQNTAEIYATAFKGVKKTVVDAFGEGKSAVADIFSYIKLGYNGMAKSGNDLMDFWKRLIAFGNGIATTTPDGKTGGKGKDGNDKDGKESKTFPPPLPKKTWDSVEVYVPKSFTANLLEGIDKVKKAWVSLGKTFADGTIGLVTGGVNELAGAFTAVVMGTKSAGQAFAQFGMSMLTNFIQLVAGALLQAYVAIPILTLLGVVSGGATAATGSGVTIAAMAGAMGAVGGYIGHREHGGPVAGGRPYIVGERGMELFVPNEPGWIMKNSQTADLMSSGGVGASHSAGGGTSSGGGGGSGGSSAKEVHIHNYIDRKAWIEASRDDIAGIAVDAVKRKFLLK